MSTITWSEVEKSLDNSKLISEGFGGADRRIVTLKSGTSVFAKISSDIVTTERLHKEIRVYEMLNKYNFSRIPELLAISDDRTAIALENLSEDHNWEWSTPWNNERLKITLEAMDLLSSLNLDLEDRDYLTVGDMQEIDEAWEIEGRVSRDALYARMSRLGFEDYKKKLDLINLEKQASKFIFNNDHLVHNDMRRDNCAWNSVLHEVRIIDWDWAQIGDRRIDINSLLVNVQKSGLDITEEFKSRLDVSALKWLANFWLKNSSIPIWEGGDDQLRDLQLQSAIAAYELSLSLS